MSILYENELGSFISHAEFIRNIYKDVRISEDKKSFQILQKLFDIKYPYKKTTHNCKIKRKIKDITDEELQSEVEYVKNVYRTFRSILVDNNIIRDINYNDGKNQEALILADNIYNSSGNHNILDITGVNKNEAVNVSIKNEAYFFPKNCKFYCSNVHDIERHLGKEKYDLILLDPPWWNKYIRRKKRKTNNSYNMMYNDELKDLPIERLIKNDGIVVVWCTNSLSNLNYLKNDIFKKWNVEYLTKWYWLKVTVNGEPVCNFSEPPSKQPFEQIIIASKNPEKLEDLKNHRLIVSVPSALHSHKPPLQDILKKYLPEDAECLEIFARYLLPNWTSYGLEAIKFQHSSLYEENIDS